MSEITPARHEDPDGPAKGWDAKDVPPDAYVDDDYLAAHSRPVDTRTTDLREVEGWD